MISEDHSIMALGWLVAELEKSGMPEAMSDWLDLWRKALLETAELDESDEFEQWAKHIREAVAPKMAESAYVVSLVPDADKVDVKFAVELGLAIMLEKPLVLVVAEGTRAPAVLAGIADAIVEHDGTPDSLRRGIAEVVDRLGIGGA